MGPTSGERAVAAVSPKPFTDPARRLSAVQTANVAAVDLRVIEMQLSRAEDKMTKLANAIPFRERP